LPVAGFLNISGDVGATLAGAIFVALLTAVTTDRRQSKSLDAEQVRFDHRLEADTVQHGQRLEHERVLKDLEELRSLLDAIAREVSSTMDQFLDMTAFVSVALKDVKAGERDVSGDKTQGLRLSTKSAGAVTSLLFQRPLLALRVGDDQAVAAFGELTQALKHAQESADNVIDADFAPDVDLIEEYQDRKEDVGTAWHSFLNEGHRLVGTRIAPHDSG
jgi:hypothetical protein